VIESERRVDIGRPARRSRSLSDHPRRESRRREGITFVERSTSAAARRTAMTTGEVDGQIDEVDV